MKRIFIFLIFIYSGSIAQDLKPNITIGLDASRFLFQQNLSIDAEYWMCENFGFQASYAVQPGKVFTSEKIAYLDHLKISGNNRAGSHYSPERLSFFRGQIFVRLSLPDS